MQPIKKSGNSADKRKHSTKKAQANRTRRSAASTVPQSSKTARIGLRVSPVRERTIRLASEIKEKSLSEFILDAAFQEAEQTLLEQRLFQVSHDKFEDFSNLLDRPPMDNEGLKQLFSKPSPWDE